MSLHDGTIPNQLDITWHDHDHPHGRDHTQVVQVVVSGALDMATAQDLAQAGQELCASRRSLDGLDGLEGHRGQDGHLSPDGAAVWWCQMDVSGLEFVDVAGLNALLALRGTVQAAGGRMQLVGLRPLPLRVLKITGLDAGFGL